MHISVHTLIYDGGNEREHIHISGDSSPICKRHLESMLKGIKSYLCLVQTGHVDIEEFRCGNKGLYRRHHRYSSGSDSLQSTNSFTSFIYVINLIFLLGEANTFFNSSYMYLLTSLLANFLTNYATS